MKNVSIIEPHIEKQYAYKKTCSPTLINHGIINLSHFKTFAVHYINYQKFQTFLISDNRGLFFLQNFFREFIFECKYAYFVFSLYNLLWLKLDNQ